MDIQLKGPYHTWKHTHRFSEVRGGTLMEDSVLYRLPFGKVGKLIGQKSVKKDISKIFESGIERY
jgi:ligand-binding SRPBCC domain-containing protein